MIKQQGGIFGRNPSFNNVSANEFSTGSGEVGNDTGNNLYIGKDDTGIRFVAASDAIQPYDPSTQGTRDNAIDLGFWSNRFKSLYLSSGVYLGGVDAPNLLDDYEEGLHLTTITPTTSGTISMPSTNNQLAYTKVGNLVHVSGYLYVSAVSSPIGAFDISLPFAAADLQDASGSSVVSVWLTNINSGANVSDFVGDIDEGNSYLRIELGDGVAVQGDSAQQIKAGTQIKISVTYKAA